MMHRLLLATLATTLVLGACSSDAMTASVPSGQIRSAGTDSIKSAADIAQFELSDAESLAVSADGWHVTSATRGYVTGGNLTTKAKLAEISLTATSESGEYPAVLCFANSEMLGGYETRFADGMVTLIDSRADGTFTELGKAHIDLADGVRVMVTCEYSEDGSVAITVTDPDENPLLAVHDSSPDRRDGRAAIRVPGAAVTVVQGLHFSTTAA